MVLAWAQPKKLDPTCPVGQSWAGLFRPKNNRPFFLPGLNPARPAKMLGSSDGHENQICLGSNSMLTSGYKPPSSNPSSSSLSEKHAANHLRFVGCCSLPSVDCSYLISWFNKYVLHWQLPCPWSTLAWWDLSTRILSACGSSVAPAQWCTNWALKATSTTSMLVSHVVGPE